MSITERAVKNPAGVAVAVAIIALFGLFSLNGLPVQLFPDIDLPQISVNANWRAASPKEVESEIHSLRILTHKFARSSYQ